MPRFYFDLREGGMFSPDDEGVEFPDLNAAEREAAEAAAAIGRDRLPKGGSREINMEVRNEHRQRAADGYGFAARGAVPPAARTAVGEHK